MRFAKPMLLLSRIRASRLSAYSLWVVVTATVLSLHSNAAEPVDRFLEKLKSAQLFSLSVVYLDQLAADGLLTENLRRDLALEKLLLKQSSLSTIRDSKTRAQEEAVVEKDLQQFLDSTPNHPRRSEARLDLANILLTRGQIALDKLQSGSQEPAEQQTAQKAFKDAVDLFDRTVAELAPILVSMQGAKIAPSDTEKLEVRRRYEDEYRRAQILSGYAMRLLGEAYPIGSPDNREWLSKSEKSLSVLVKEKTSPGEGAHTLSLLFLAQVQALLGKTAEAQDSFQRVADIEESGPFRLWRVEATTALLGLLATRQQGKFEFIIDRALNLLKTMEPDERSQPKWIDLQLATAKAQIAWSEAPNQANNLQSKIKSNRVAARKSLLALVRMNGKHQEAVRQLLASLGVEERESHPPLTAIKTFAEAKEKAEKLIVSADTAASLTLEILRKRRLELPAADRARIDAEIESANVEIQQDRDQAMQLLERAIQLYSKKDSRTEWAQARRLMAYVLAKSDKYWESAAIADFLARSNAGSELGLLASSLALYDYRRLLDTGDADRKTNLMPAVESLANYMLEVWPSAPESQGAVQTLLQLSLTNQRWDDAKRYLGLMSTDGAKAGEIRRDIGFILWTQYLIGLESKRKAGQEVNAEDQRLREEAESMLKSGWESLTPDTLNPRAVEAANALVALYLRTDRVAEAASILDSPLGPLAMIRREGSLVADPKIKLESLRLNLQRLVSSSGNGAGQALEPAKVSQAVQEMGEVAGGVENGNQLLTNALLRLAQGLKEQIDLAQSSQAKGQLVGSIQILLSQLVSVVTDAGTLDWAGRLMFSIAEELKEEPALKDASKQLMSGASAAFSRMLVFSGKDPNFLASINKKPQVIRLQYAMALRGQGEYEKAIEIFKAALLENNRDLVIQVEAAKTFQEWSGGTQADLLTKAIVGESDKKSGTNLIWGWGKISQTVASRPEFQTHFFDAKYQMAKCRYQLAILHKNPKERTDDLKSLIGQIKSAHFQSNELGGPASWKKFDQLLRQVQSDLGTPTIGLKAFE